MSKEFRGHHNPKGGPHQKGGHYDSRQQDELEKYLLENMEAILHFKTTGKVEELLDKLSQYVKSQCGDITTSQLRNIFSKIKPIKKWNELQHVRPKLVYIAARQNKLSAKQVVQFLESVISKVNADEYVDDFIAFFEAIVAYHKFHHSEKKQPRA